jgi:7-keto-8-aminopelargonate synthetase-like enzyme
VKQWRKCRGVKNIWWKHLYQALGITGAYELHCRKMCCFLIQITTNLVYGNILT